MAPYLPVPQTSVDKAQLEDDLTELVSVSGQSTPRQSQTRVPATPSSTDPTAEAASKLRQKSPHPPQPQRLLEPADVFHRVSIGSFSGETGRFSPSSFRAFSPAPDPNSTREPPPQPLKSTALGRFWVKHRPVLYVFFAQLFGSLMHLSARLLELEKEHAMDPFQLLFIRMVVTTSISSVYMYRARVPHFPFGPPAVRWLLVARGLTGFFGLYGMWYSMMYLPLAEATVITFLTPSVLAFICHVFLKDQFTRKEKIASGLAFLGVILITRPESLFSTLAPGAPSAAGQPANTTAEIVAALGPEITPVASAAATIPAAATSTSLAATVIRLAADAAANATEVIDDETISKFVPTAAQRLVAIGVALLGVLGAAFAFTTIRAIGPRAHPLISVNYFSTCCLFVSATVLTLAPLLNINQPALRFGLPDSLRQWALVFFICFCGFLTQLFATKGFGSERSNRANAMMYTQMLFAAFFDRFVFGNEMGLISLVGCGLIIGSALWVALTQKPAENKPRAGDVESGTLVTSDLELGATARIGSGHEIPHGSIPAESVPMLEAEDSDEDDEEPVREGRAQEVTVRPSQ